MMAARIESAVLPSAWASKFRMMRCRRTAGGEFFDVVDAQMETPVHQGEHTPALHQRLRPAGRTAVADVAPGQFVRARLVRLRCHYELDGIILNMRRDQNFAAYGAKLEHVVAVEHGVNRGILAAYGAFHDARSTRRARGR